MRTFRQIGMVLAAVLMCVNFASCSNEEELVTDNPQEGKYITVGLGCKGEFLDFADSPLGRSTDDELYGIQVYTLTENSNYTDGYEQTYYAYGMFTSLDNVKIKLLDNQLYRFEVSIVIDPLKNGGSYYDWFNQPSTEFTYSTTEHIYVDDISHRKHDRFYGKLDKYTPEENGSVDIYTKRVSYGAKYIAQELTEGTLSVDVIPEGTYGYDYTVELTSEAPINDDIYTFTSIQSAWKGIWDKETEEYKNYYKNKKLSINWTKADGTVLPLGTYTVTFKRNVKTTIKIKAENLNTESGIKVYKEEVSMIDDENIYEINGGTITEVPVTNGN